MPNLEPNLLPNVLYTDGTHEQDIAMRQISVKDPDSHSWFVSCNELLHKYSLPIFYTVRAEFESEPQFKQQVKASVDKYLFYLFIYYFKMCTLLDKRPFYQVDNMT